MRYVSLLKSISLVVALVLFASPNISEAQRPSLGGLQLQINRMLAGDEDFARVSFGDSCWIGIDPDLTGLVESDPGGLRLLGQNLEGCILRFGPTDDCWIGIDPKQDAMVFNGDGCFVFNNPLPGARPIIQMAGGEIGFGPTCTIGIDPELEGLVFRDIGCFIFENPDPNGAPEILMEGGTLRFGDECTIGVDPNMVGLVESDPGGFRLLGQDQQGCILRFGPSDDCTIGIDPANQGGMIFRDRGCFIFQNPDPNGVPELSVGGGMLSFGDNCRLRVDPELTGMIEEDPGGLRLLGQNGVGCILTFGPTDGCRILVDPTRTDTGLIVQEENTVLFENPLGPGTSNVAVDGTISANEFSQTSRRDLKKNIRAIESPLEKVGKLRGVYFDWKDSVKQAKEGQSNSEIGFIADEVADVIPEAAVYNDEKVAQGVKYANLVALVVESVKEQQTQIESQQEQIAAQQEMIEELREQVALLVAAQQK